MAELQAAMKLVFVQLVKNNEWIQGQRIRSKCKWRIVRFWNGLKFFHQPFID